MASTVSGAVGAGSGISDEQRGMIHPQKRFIDRIGETALLADFAVEPRRQASAAENVVDDIAGHEIRIAALEAWPAERHHGLRNVERNEGARCGGLAASTSATGTRPALGSNPPNVWSSNLPSVAGSISPTTAIFSVSWPVRGRRSPSGRRHRSGNALQSAVARPAMGMIAKGDFQQLAAGQRIPDWRFRAASPTLTCVRMRSTSLPSKRGEVSAIRSRSRLRPCYPEHAQRAAEIVPCRAEAQFDGAALETLVEGLGIRSPEPSSSRLATMLPTPGLSAGSCVAPPPRHTPSRSSGTGGIRHKPGPRCLRRNQMLDFCCGVRGVAASGVITRQAASTNATRRPMDLT